MRAVLVAVLSLVSLPAFTDELRVGDARRFLAQAGEAQSTVVPPGVKPTACPQGRLLVSIDLRRPPARGLVLGRDLGTVDEEATVEATFNPPPNAADYAFGTNDHDLVVLPNGDVLYATGAFSRRPLTPKPAWFDVTYRGTFGPGARSVLLTWRSTDCGRTFRFVSDFDPARVADGSCALPQFPRLTTAPGTPDRPVFDMGGSDGQLVQVDRATGRLYLTFGCVGYVTDISKLPRFELSGTRLNKTLLATSVNGGSSWTSLGFIPIYSWRFQIAPLALGPVAFATGTTVLTGVLDAGGVWTPPLGSTAHAVPGGVWGWDATSFYKNPKIPLDRIGSHIWASTVLSRSGVGARSMVIAFPTTIAGGAGASGTGTASTRMPASPAASSSSLRPCRRPGTSTAS